MLQTNRTDRTINTTLMAPMITFTFTFLQPTLTPRQFADALSARYRSNHKFARMIGTRVAPAWANGTLEVDIDPRHQPNLERWLAHFWSRNSGMTQEEALLRAQIGMTTLKGATPTPAARARKSNKLRQALKDLWSTVPDAPSPKTLINRFDPPARVYRWMQADKADAKRVNEWKAEALDLPFRIGEPWDLRPAARDTLPQVIDIHVDTLHTDNDTASDRKREDWAHASDAPSDFVKVGEDWFRLNQIPRLAPDLARVAAAAGDEEALDSLEAAFERIERDQQPNVWSTLQLEGATGSTYARVRTWVESNRRPTGKRPPFRTERREHAPVTPKLAPHGPWYHSGIKEWQVAAQGDKELAAQLEQHQQQYAEFTARKQTLENDAKYVNGDDDDPNNVERWNPTPAQILELLQEDKSERAEHGEPIPTWLERQIAFYTHVVAKDEQPPTTDANDEEPACDPKLDTVGAITAQYRTELHQLERELELSKKPRRGLIGSIAQLRILLARLEEI